MVCSIFLVYFSINFSFGYFSIPLLAFTSIKGSYYRNISIYSYKAFHPDKKELNIHTNAKINHATKERYIAANIYSLVLLYFFLIWATKNILKLNLILVLSHSIIYY